jgi:hypothetical protein
MIVDADALDRITAIERADGQPLENGVRTAISNFITGCKTDGIWNSLKRCTILMGARTLSGALVDLKTGTTVATNNLFVPADYDRKTGLLGDGRTKYIDSGHRNDADPQNSNHNAVYVTSLGTMGGGGSTPEEIKIYMGTGDNDGDNMIAYHNPGNVYIGERTLLIRNRATPQQNSYFQDAAVGFIGHSRSSSASFTQRTGKENCFTAFTSNRPNQESIRVFARGSAGIANPSDARISFYSIGEAINLVALESRVEALSGAIAGAIL